jgi:hypothetical protein
LAHRAPIPFACRYTLKADPLNSAPLTQTGQPNFRRMQLMKRILIVSAAVVLGALGLMAAEQASAQRVMVPGQGPERGMQGTYGFWAASQPANSNRVGIFIAHRIPGKDPELYYCSSPADAASKDPAICKRMENFPK